ncbi:tetratricopeptide repeat protein [uncultured Thiothrix sp.]|uniref:tetratricopeptide repeat protein n=1 Tax=uncultured Thiothrix sp. TaxID=223185 RepID=UPI00261664E0|nr:tetratricopeptide repeat protein [uncultured Thiothrix sp.]
MSQLQIGHYFYDLNQQQLSDSNHQPCILRNQSLQVLHYLASHANQLVSKDELFTKVWKGSCVTDDSLVQCIAEIRQSLQDKQHQLLKTVPRRGYILIAAEKLTSKPSRVFDELLPLLGRSQELHQLEQMLLDPACRLITLLGFGGVGKSRLAKTLMQSCRLQFSQGIYWVELVTVQCARLIPSAIAASIGLSLQGQRSPVEQLQRALAHQQALIILDNFEHLLPDEEHLCENLLTACPQLKILLTSRKPLQVYGEWLYHLQGLAVTPLIQAAASCPSFVLFVQTARRVNYSFAPTEEDQALILQICRLVNGMPLGIEIAATWLKHLSCAEVLTELKQQLTTLNTTTDPEAIGSLRQVLMQSWQMLSPREQRMMQVLSLFRGGFTREAASAITGAHLGDYSGLIDKSMLSREPTGHYILHEVMREYASHLRIAEDSEWRMAQRFIEYYLELASTADAQILSGRQLTIIQQLTQENDHFRECLSLCLAAKQLSPKGLSDLGLNLAGSLGMFWFLSNHWQEGFSWLERFLGLHRNAPPSLAQGMALLAAGGISAVLDKHSLADQYVQAGRNMAEHFGGKISSARGLFVLSILRRLQGRYLESVESGQQSMRLFMDSGDEGGYQINLVNVGHALLKLGRENQAIQLFEECISLNQKIGLTLSMPYALINLGRVNAQLKQVQLARAYLQQSIQLTEQLGFLLYRAQALCSLGYLELSEGNVESALVLLQKSMTDYLQLGDQEGQIAVMLGIGAAKAFQGHLKLAWQCIVVAENLAKYLKLQDFTDYPALLHEAKQRIQQGLGAHELIMQRNLGLVYELEDLFNSVL